MTKNKICFNILNWFVSMCLILQQDAYYPYGSVNEINLGCHDPETLHSLMLLETKQNILV